MQLRNKPYDDDKITTVEAYSLCRILNSNHRT